MMKNFIYSHSVGEYTIHAISTGEVSVKSKFRESSQKGFLGVLSFLLDRNFTEWMPIWTWLIEHPEGLFLIDTGENAQVNEEDYFNSSGFFNKWLNRSQFKFRVQREQEIDQALKQLGFSRDQVDRLILTHLHLDHIDGLRHFPNTPVLLHDLEWKKPYGHLPKLFPVNFKPQLLSLEDDLEDWGKVHYLSKAKDLALVATPGHTHGHCSVLLKTGEKDILFAGDVVYYEKQLLDNRFSGGNINPKAAQASYRKILNYARKNPLVVLPSHDGEATQRLKNLQVLAC